MKNTNETEKINDGKVSCIVGMWANIWKDDELIYTVYIKGKENDDHYIVQSISAIDGSLNTCHIIKFEDMLDWSFIPNKNIYDECYGDYIKTGKNRYGSPIKKK